MTEHATLQISSNCRVSCVMPTFGRPDLVPESVGMFLAQDYPHKELIILNDCPDQTYVSSHPDVKVVNARSRFPSLGEKRNEAIRMATGQLIAVWDDDDIYLPWRLSLSVAQMRHHDTPLFIPDCYWAYWGTDRLLTNNAAPGWISHPACMFSKALWQAAGEYPAITLGEDSAFFQKAIALMGETWPVREIAWTDRFMILRGTSPYHHTSIEGGAAAADTRPAHIRLEAREITDPILRTARDRLIQTNTYAKSARDAGHRQPTPDRSRWAWLDVRPPELFTVGYGQPGLHGELGFEDKSVCIAGERPLHAISAHAPSELSWTLDGSFSWFHSHVALNDDVIGAETSADFELYADDRLVGIAGNVSPTDMNRSITADISGARKIRLIARPRRWDYCHSVWVDPKILPAPDSIRFDTDCLKRVRVESPVPSITADVCIATVGSPGFEDWVDDLLGSIVANAQCPEAVFVVFFLGDSPKIRHICRKYQARLIPCRSMAHQGPAMKSILYSLGRFVSCRRMICLDADMLVLDDLRPVLHAIDASPTGSVLVCREARWARNLSHAMSSIYDGQDKDFSVLLNGTDTTEAEYPLVVNDGLLAGTHAAFCAVDETIRWMATAPQWLDQNTDCAWRNQMVLNLALAKLQCGIELDSAFNVQLNCRRVEFRHAHGMLTARSEGRPSKIVHFNGAGRHAAPEGTGHFARISNPTLQSADHGDLYQSFVSALRKWIGQSGAERMRWTFYGTADGHSAVVRDPDWFSLYAVLFSLIRANGCSRVLETGTFRGVSSACMASAIADRPGAALTTFDPEICAERADLWHLLPQRVLGCIHPHNTDGVEGMNKCLDAGQTYHAALLDSIHEREHVVSEFQLASQLVCSGGLILIHDSRWEHGSVGQALDEIESAGFPVVRLWEASDGVPQDDNLGLAVIENRRR